MVIKIGFIIDWFPEFCHRLATSSFTAWWSVRLNR